MDIILSTNPGASIQFGRAPRVGDFDAAVFRAACIRIVVGDGHLRAETPGGEPVGGYTVLREPSDD